MTPTVLGLLYVLVGLVFLVPAIAPITYTHSYGWLAFLWPCVCFVTMGVLYMAGPRGWALGLVLLGKNRFDGSIAPLNGVLCAPYLLPLWVAWLFKHSVTRAHENPFDLIAPGIYLGRWPFVFNQFPSAAECTLIDLTGEMTVPWRALKGRQFICLPALDHCAPNFLGMSEVGELIANRAPPGGGETSSVRSLDLIGDGGAHIQGDVYIFCANGRGRSASLAGVVLVMRGDCATFDEALERIRRVRPQVHVEAHQRLAAQQAVDHWMAEGGAARLNLRRASRLQLDGPVQALRTTERERSLSWGMKPAAASSPTSPRSQDSTVRVPRHSSATPPKHGEAAATPTAAAGGRLQSHDDTSDSVPRMEQLAAV